MNKESIIQFLKPDWRKIILAIMFYILSVLFISSNIVCLMAMGIPCPDAYSVAVFLLPFSIVFYFISCFLVFALGKVKNRYKV